MLIDLNFRCEMSRVIHVISTGRDQFFAHVQGAGGLGVMGGFDNLASLTIACSDSHVESTKQYYLESFSTWRRCGAKRVVRAIFGMWTLAC